MFKKHRLPDDIESTSPLANFIGSAQDCTAAFLIKSTTSPLATTSATTSNNNQVSFSTINSTVEDSTSSISFVGIPPSSKFKLNSQEPVCHNPEDDDYLNSDEISKIECFYNSMGCYVYVSRCVAQLYQIKREDEFDSVDSDPVNDYHIYMKNKQRLYDNTDSSYPHMLTDEEANCLNKSSVNYMYINSGVPVIVFNYGASTKRKKELRIVLAERSTGFCMFEFKFDCITQFENSTETTVYRLSQNTSTLNSHKTSNFFSNTNLNYQNEYFEKFFNSKKRHAYKEHLLKFAIKRDCDEFCFKLVKIMNDKRNSEYLVSTTNEKIEESKNRNYYTSNHSLNSLNSLFSNYQGLLNAPSSSSQPCSTLILCHFDFLSYNTSTVNLTHKNSSLSTLSLGMYAQEDILDTTSIQIKKSSIKPAKLHKNYSSSSSNITPYNFDKNKYYLSRNESFRSYDDNNDNLSTIESNVSESELKQLNGSVLTGSVLGLDSINNNNRKKEHSDKGSLKSFLVKYKKLKKSDISSPLNFNHVTHLDKPVPIGKRYKFDY